MEPGLPNRVELTAQTFLKQEMVTLHVQRLTAAECNWDIYTQQAEVRSTRSQQLPFKILS